MSTTPPTPPPPPAAPPPPHPSGLPGDVRNWAMAAHLSALGALVIGFAFVGPLIVWLVKRDHHPFIDAAGKEAVNFNISITIYFLIAAVSLLLLVGLVLLPAVAIFWLVMVVIGSIRASNGELYRYPLTIRFVS